MAEKYARERKALRKNLHEILAGRVLVVDPSSISMGYAILEKGELVSSGEFQVKGHIGHRLSTMYTMITELGDFDLLAIEKIRGSRSHAYLFWAVGMIVSALKVPVVELPHPMWRVTIDTDYVKGDEVDAIYMSRFVSGFAKGDIP